MTVKLLAMAASTRPESLNKRLLSVAVADAQKAKAEVIILDYADCEAPLYQGEEGQPLPPGVQHLADALHAHDGLLLASPEYNWSMPGSLKNLIDWLSLDATRPLKGKHALLMCASPSIRGGILGLNQLSVPLSHLGVHVYPHVVAISDAREQLSGDDITNPKDRQFLQQCVTDFVQLTNKAKR